jgi:hypothetical protein
MSPAAAIVRGVAAAAAPNGWKPANDATMTAAITVERARGVRKVRQSSSITPRK